MTAESTGSVSWGPGVGVLSLPACRLCDLGGNHLTSLSPSFLFFKMMSYTQCFTMGLLGDLHETRIRGPSPASGCVGGALPQTPSPRASAPPTGR